MSGPRSFGSRRDLEDALVDRLQTRSLAWSAGDSAVTDPPLLCCVGWIRARWGPGPLLTRVIHLGRAQPVRDHAALREQARHLAGSRGGAR